MVPIYFTKEPVLAESKIGKPAVPTKPAVLPRPANVIIGQQTLGGSFVGHTSPNLMTGRQARGGSTGGQLTSFAQARLHFSTTG